MSGGIGRPLEKYLSNKPNGSYEKTKEEMGNIKCWEKKVNKINEYISTAKVERDSLIDDLIGLIKSNSSKHKQFLKEEEIKAIESYISDCFLIKRKILLKTLHEEPCQPSP